LAQLEEKLSSMLGDDEGRQNFLRIVSMLGNAKESPAQEAAEGADFVPPAAESPASSDDSSGGQSTTDDKTSALFSALPQLLAALSGSGDTLDSKRVNLIRAISPYLSEERGEYIARAIRMASVAKAAKDTLGVLGR